MEHIYELFMRNSQGAITCTKHHKKQEVRDEIRTWDAKGMTAQVFLHTEQCATEIYNGPALKF